jgi:hypothetical protein
MDEMIQKLADAKPYDLPLSVQRAYRVVSSPRFFMRIAELADLYTDDTDPRKMKLITLADNLVSTLDAIVSTTQEKMQAYAIDVESVVKAAAEPDSGEFLVPLSIERMDAMRTAMQMIDTVSLDGDTFVSTVDAYMSKSQSDGLELMVVILQNVLQLYAGRRILEARRLKATSNQGSTPVDATTTTSVTSAANQLLDDLLQTDSDRWDSTIRNGLVTRTNSLIAGSSTNLENDGDIVTPKRIAEEVIIEIQRNMETILLSLESGSMAQRVQAEYLQELVKRIELVQTTS